MPGPAGSRPRQAADVLLVVAGGLAYAAALPPHDHAALAWVALVPLLAVATRRGRRGAFAAGALYGCVFFATIVPWVVGAVRAYFETSLVVAVAFGAAICALYVAAYVGLFAVAARALLARGPWPALVALPGLWVGVELARTRLLTGLPWGLLGHSQWSVPVLIQTADLGGAYVVSYLVATVNVGLWLACDAWRRAVPRRAFAVGAPLLAACAPLLAASGLVAASVGYGIWRLADEDVPAVGPEARTVMLVQGNPPLTTTWQQAASERALALYGGLTRRAAAEHPDLVVWPEYALQLYPEQDARVLPMLTGLAAATPAGLVFGAPRAVESTAGGTTYRNAAYHVAPDGTVAAYEKRRLVPFAEYQPLGLAGSAADREDRRFSAGERARPFATTSGRLGMLICYEVIYPTMVRDLVRDGAEMLVNVANDGWLDVARLGAAEQHLAIAAFRAVETRRYLARAASTGISGFVAPSGRPFGLLATGVRGVTAGRVVPRAELTPYVRVGDAFAFAVLTLGLGLLARARARKAP